MVITRCIPLFVFTLLLPLSVGAQQSDPSRIIDARINRYCHPPDDCVLRGALLWDSTNVTPRYPEIMRSVGIDGEAALTFRVLPNGTVDPQSITYQHLSNRAFDEPIRAAVRQWKFRVASSDEPKPVTTGIEIVFAFIDKCRDDLGSPMSAMIANQRSTRLMVLVCRDFRPSH